MVFEISIPWLYISLMLGCINGAKVQLRLLWKLWRQIEYNNAHELQQIHIANPKHEINFKYVYALLFFKDGSLSYSMLLHGSL